MEDLVNFALIPYSGWNWDIARDPRGKPTLVQWNVELRNITGEQRTGTRVCVCSCVYNVYIFVHVYMYMYIHCRFTCIHIPTGVLRNVSSAGEAARVYMRQVW